MIKNCRKHLTPHLKTTGSRLATFALLLSLAACGSSDDPNDEQSDGIFGTGIQLNGTVSTQFALADDSVEFKRQSGEKGTQAVNSDGTFAAEQVQGSGAVLLRSATDTGESLYALALPEDQTEVNQNVHSYSDLVARNWFASNGQDINAVFNASGELTSVPTANELLMLQNTVSQFYSGVQDDYNIEGANIFTDQYLANGVGIDEFLVVNPVIINNDVINIFVIDPSTNIQSAVTSALNVNNSLLLGDTEIPSTPEALRALPAASDEIIVVWDSAVDNIAVAGYDVYRDGALLDSSPYPVFADDTITPGTEHTYFVIAVDSSGNQSSASLSVSAQTLVVPDSIAPAAPTDLSLQPEVGSIALSWSHVDTDDVASFIVNRGPSAGGTVEYLSVTSTSLTDLNVINGTQYCYQVTAIDGSGNPSLPSDVRCAVAGGAVVDPETVDQVDEPANVPVNIAIGTEGDYTLGSCVAQATSVASSADIDAPVRLTQGQIASGMLMLNTAESNHYWSFDVPEGDYALVVEGSTGDLAVTSNIIFNVVEVDERGIEKGQLRGFNEVDNRVRDILPVSVGASGLHLKLEASFAREQTYQIALYSLEDVIPTPFLTDCPDATVTTVGTTEAFSINGDEDKYFLIELEAGEYEVLIDSTTLDGLNTNIIFNLKSYGLANTISTERELVQLNEVDSFFRTVVTIAAEDNGLVYLRWSESLYAYNIEFSLSRL